MSSGTDKIVSSIMSEAQEKADVIIQDANANASEITSKAEKTADAEKIKILENGKKQSDMRYQQIISEAKMNARRAKLGAKEEVIEAAFNQATGELKAKAANGDDEYKDSLGKMIKEAADEIGQKDLILQLNETDTKLFKDDLSSNDFDSFVLGGNKFTLGEPIDSIKGAILKTASGSKKVNIELSDGEDFELTLSKKIKAAVDKMDANDFILHFNGSITQTIKNQLSSDGAGSFSIGDVNFTLGEPIDTIGGAVVKTVNGDIEVNNTIEARLERYKSILRSEVANVLFK